jgi:hypothetical protein
MGLDPHIAVGRQKHHETSVPSAEEDVSQQEHQEASVPTVQEEQQARLPPRKRCSRN